MNQSTAIKVLQSLRQSKPDLAAHLQVCCRRFQTAEEILMSLVSASSR